MHSTRQRIINYVLYACFFTFAGSVAELASENLSKVSNAVQQIQRGAR